MGPTSRGTTLARLNILLGILLVALLAGPPLARWLRPGEPGPSATAPSRAIPATARPPLEGPGPVRAPAEPTVTIGGAEGTLAREAQELYRTGRVAEACDRFREVVRRAPSDEARRNLGSCLARLGRDAYQADQAQAAVQYYREALDADQAAPVEVWAWLATALVKAGDLSRAQSTLEQALGRFPGDAEARYLLAEIQERQGRTREALDTLKRLLAARPEHARAKTLLASLEREQKVEGSYWAQESPHFLVRYEGAPGIDLGRSVIDTLEEAYESIGRDLGTFPKDRLQVGIYAAPVFGDVIGAPPHLIAGAYDGQKLRLNLSASNAYSGRLTRLVRHEYTHAVIHIASNGRAPVWVHEGLAQAMEPRSASRFLPVGVPREYLTLSGIERLSRTANAEALVAGYSLTLVAVEYLLDRGGLSSMRAFLSRLGQGEAVADALRGAYGFGPEEVEARLLAAGGKG